MKTPCEARRNGITLCRISDTYLIFSWPMSLLIMTTFLMALIATVISSFQIKQKNGRTIIGPGTTKVPSSTWLLMSYNFRSNSVTLNYLTTMHFVLVHSKNEGCIASSEQQRCFNYYWSKNDFSERYAFITMLKNHIILLWTSRKIPLCEMIGSKIETAKYV